MTRTAHLEDLLVQLLTGYTLTITVEAARDMTGLEGAALDREMERLAASYHCDLVKADASRAAGYSFEKR